MEPETIEAEVTEQMGQALEVAAPAPVNLFRTEDPAEVVRRATAVADTLSRVLRDKNLISKIGKSEHVKVEGWTLCGTMLGVFPVLEWTRKLRMETDGEDGWEARVEARTLSGAVVGAAEAECLRSENQWGWEPRGRDGRKLEARDDYALRSMAQTRATSKALRQPLGFIVQLAGFDPTPAEEMSRDDEQRKEGGLGPIEVPRSWAKVREWYDRYGGPGAWELAEAFARAAMYHLYGQTESKELTPDQRKVMLQKSATVVVWLSENENTPLGNVPAVDHYRKAWATVLDGAALEVPDWTPPEPPIEAPVESA